MGMGPGGSDAESGSPAYGRAPNTMTAIPNLRMFMTKFLGGRTPIVEPFKN